MLCSRTSGHVNWPRVTDVSELVGELVDAGLPVREARWLVQEFRPGTDPDAVVALRSAARRRLAGEPLQYILGHWPFRTLDLDVDARVLIPRPETEELVEVALRELSAGGATAPLIVDLGCGSGAIGLSLLDELRSRGIVGSLVALDASLDALAVARRNAAKHELVTVTFVHSSWYDNLDATMAGHVDLIVANPPYVGAVEFEELDPVLRHEPRGAIVAPDTSDTVGFADLATVIAGAPAWLAARGVLVCEHANVHRAAALRAARDAGFTGAQDLDDMSGRPRILVARRS